MPTLSIAKLEGSGMAFVVPDPEPPPELDPGAVATKVPPKSEPMDEGSSTSLVPTVQEELASVEDPRKSKLLGSDVLPNASLGV